jgi:16S rRNA (adenine(1408)-N(1))-methyltransferase
MDLGTGDGRSVLARAAVDPGTLGIGLDASAAAMAEASRRAERRGPANALFLAAGVESLAGGPLVGIADLVTVTFPWGSLLRGVLGRDDAVLAGVAALLAPGATARVLLSVVARDGVPAIPSPDRLAAAYAPHGVRLLDARPATPEEVAASGSSWAKRLKAGAARPVTLLQLATT